jgi:hypothetical protein
MKNFIKLLGFFFVSMIAFQVNAEEEKSNKKSSPYPYDMELVGQTSSVTIGQSAAIVYLLTNNIGKDSLTLVDNQYLSAGITQVTNISSPTGSPYNAQPTCPVGLFTMAKGSSCYVKYTVDTNHLIGTVTGQPRICMSGNNSNCMIAGGPEDNFNITISAAQLIPITVAPAGADPLVLGASTTWTITNQCGLSSSCAGYATTTANAIDVTFSLGGANAFVPGSFVNNCGTLLASQSCTITATVAAAPPSGTPQTFEAFFQGTNTTQAVDFPSTSSVAGVLTTLLGNIVVISPQQAPHRFISVQHGLTADDPATL